MTSRENFGGNQPSAVTLASVTSLGELEHGGSFALRKRLLVPRWWLVGTFCSGHRVGTKGDGLFEAFASERLGEVIYAASAISPRTLFCLANFWHAVCRSFLAGQGESVTPLDARKSITVPLSELFRGTASARESAFADFRRAIMAPFEAMRIVRSERTRTLGQTTLQSTGAATTLIRNLSFADDDTLTVEFLMPIVDVISGKACSSVAAPGFVSSRALAVSVDTFTNDSASKIVTLSPNVLKWHGDKSSMRKLHLYLYLELTKSLGRNSSGRGQTSLCDPGIGMTLLAKLSHEQAKDFFGDFVMRASGLYDHGVLGWSESFPHGRIADLMPAGTRPGSVCLQVVRLSDHMIQVLRFEEAVSQRLVPEVADSLSLSQNGGRDSVHSLLPKPELSRASTGKVNAFPNLSHSHCGTSASHRGRRRIGGLSRFAKRERPGADQEMEYVLKLAQYYESLTPSQRSELDREMKHRTQADFRAWLGPILDRTH